MLPGPFSGTVNGVQVPFGVDLNAPHTIQKEPGSLIIFPSASYTFTWRCMASMALTGCALASTSTLAT
jgi:hypothetical protein